ncbi:hypothetical protein BHE74_00036358 [Ensete ventricosum]|nr:hypothetical protein BHE74_00036358 [Ensete ventricosum]RZR85972.1 hypothetical protein BHM03_00013064 [Ensete ventricosum]
MSQEHTQSSNLGERPEEQKPIAHSDFGIEGQLPLSPHMDGNTSTSTPSRY